MLGSVLDHFGTMLAPFWPSVASSCGVLWCAVSCCVAKNALNQERSLTAGFIMNFEVAERAERSGAKRK